MNEYSIENAFSAIEQELINSMLRNYKKHKAWEKDEGFNWTMWQAEQLKNLQRYRIANKDKFKTRFTDINDEIDEMLRKAYMAGGMSQETKILKAIKRGYIPNNIPERINEFISNNKGKSLKEIASDLIARFKGEKVVGFNAEFFKINDRKLNELIKATKNDFEKAEIAMLRRSNDIYRKTIYNSQVYFNTGAGTYEKAVDMATKDFLAKGIDCIEYKNGARVNICDYVSMYLQTANKRAYLQGEGAKRQEWGIHTVIIVNRGGGCPKCTPFQGRVFIDDVWSGGSAKDGDYPLLSSAIAAGLYHPRCKDSHTTYFPGISSEPKPPSKEEQQRAIETYNMQQKKKYAERMVRKYGNLEQYSVDCQNKERYKAKRKEWSNERNKIHRIGEFENDDSHIDILEDEKGVQEWVDRALSIGVGSIDIKHIKNVEVLNPLLDELEELKNEYGKVFNRIESIDLKENTIAQLNGRVLQLNQRYFNDKKILESQLNKWHKNNMIPKGCNSIEYVVTHEYMHLLTQDKIDVDKKFDTMFNRAKKEGKCIVCSNSAYDKYEFVADLLSANRISGIKNKFIDKLLDESW